MSTVMSDSDVLANLSANLSKLMQERGMSRSELARLTNENVMTISRTARGTNMPGAAVLARIAEALGVSTDWLVASHAPKRSSKKSS